MESLTALKAPTQRFKESVVLVHHYGGHKFSFKRQIEYLNELGFDVYTFDLPGADVFKFDRSPFHSKGVGYRRVWADEIAKVLDQVPGTKFVYSFSSPSSAALEAMIRRKCHDIRGWICDGGPFTDVRIGMTNLIHEGIFLPRFIKNEKLHRLYSKNLGYLLAFFWGSSAYESEMRELLERLPKDFPIISFRSQADKLVSPKMIDDFFALAGTSVQPVLLDHSPHLAGFKIEAERYKAFLFDYLRRYATVL